ncbi:hypothetical protein V7S78_12015 [Aquirufa regiilacus]
MILTKIKLQEAKQWYLTEELTDRLVYRTNFVSDPFAAMEFVRRKGNPEKIFVLFKSEDNPTGMELFFQKEIIANDYLLIAENMSEMFYEFIC